MSQSSLNLLLQHKYLAQQPVNKSCTHHLHAIQSLGYRALAELPISFSHHEPKLPSGTQSAKNARHQALPPQLQISLRLKNKVSTLVSQLETLRTRTQDTEATAEKARSAHITIEESLYRLKDTVNQCNNTQIENFPEKVAEVIEDGYGT